MTTEMKTSDAPPKAAHQLELTNGAIYLLEGCLQDLSGCNTPDKILKWGKCWKYIRSQNDRMIRLAGSDEAIDFEIPLVPKAGESAEELQVRVAALNVAHTAWTKQPKVLAINDKRRDICRDAVKWWIGHKSDGRGKRMDMSENLLLLLEALGLVDDEGSGDE